MKRSVQMARAGIPSAKTPGDKSRFLGFRKARVYYELPSMPWDPVWRHSFWYPTEGVNGLLKIWEQQGTAGGIVGDLS